MPLVTCNQILEEEIKNETRRRYEAEIAALKDMGFREMCGYTETIIPFSLVLFFPIYLAMLKAKEVVKIQSPLRIVGYYVLFFSQEHATYAHVFGLGTKFYTSFTDGTWLISANFATQPISDAKRGIWKYAFPINTGPLGESMRRTGKPAGGTGQTEPLQLVETVSLNTIKYAWEQHQEKISRFKSEGKQTKDRASFEEYVEISRQEDQSMLPALIANMMVSGIFVTLLLCVLSLMIRGLL